MQQNLIENLNIEYKVGLSQDMADVCSAPVKEPFSSDVVEFLSNVSKELLSNPIAKTYPDVVTFAFWIRKASIGQIKDRVVNDDLFRVGRGVAFHIAPSNVPVNYAYSLVVGLLTGNINIVRIPTKDFDQVDIINAAIKKCMTPELSKYVFLIKYGHNKDINDVLSSMADIRIIWGGDATISDVRKSPLRPRSTEITFADRYSLAVINADYYLDYADSKRVANDFYNDTFLSDQNACTSPRVVVWMGNNIEKAQDLFWSNLYSLVKEKYTIQGVQVVNKLTSMYITSNYFDIKQIPMPDNLIVRLKINELVSELMKFKDNSGYFYEFNCDDIMQLKNICNNASCQTISYIGNKDIFNPLIRSGIKGIDRIVPVGKTMDFDFIWDGYNLFERMSRVIIL